MSRILLDTSAVIGCFERRERSLISMIARADSPVAVSVLTLGELEHGHRVVPDASRGRSLEGARAMMHIEIDGVTGPECFGMIASQVSRRVSQIDCWIAASATLTRSELVTQDRRLAEELGTVDWAGTAWKAPTITYVPIGA